MLFKTMALRFRTLILFWLINLIFSDSHILHTYSSRSESHSSSHINHNAIFCNHSSHKCIINCFNDKYCVNKIIVCPSDGKCEINCHVKHSCFNTSIIANSSNHLTVNAFYTYSTYYTNVYCPLSQNTHCQIYGHSQDSLQNVNIYINSYHQNYQIKCQQDDNECGDYNINNNNNNNQHFHSRKLLAPTTSTLYIEPNITTTMSQQIKNEDLLPFGFNLNQATTAWILIIAVILIICLFCCVMGLCCCMCRQQKTKGTKFDNRKDNDENVAAFTNNNSNSRNSRHSRHSYNNSNDSIRLRYLVLAYENGKTIKIPFDLATMDHLGNENVAMLNSNHVSNISNATLINKIGTKQPLNGRPTSNSNYLSDSLHAALSDENNKIVSAVIMDSNGSNDDDLENSNQGNTTVAPLALEVVENGMDIMDTSNNHSPIDVIMEDDTDFIQSGNGNTKYLTSDDDTLISPNANTKLIKVGGKNPQRIIQSSLSFTNSMEYGYKKYKTRQDSERDLHLDENKETELTSSTTLTSSSHPSEIEMQSKPSLHNDATNTFNSDKRILHTQSSSQPHVLKPRNNKYNQNRPRPKTAHIITPKDDEEIWNRTKHSKHVNNDMSLPEKQQINTNINNNIISNHVSSWDSDQRLSSLKQYMGRQLMRRQNGDNDDYDNEEEIPPMQTSISVPMNNKNNSNNNRNINHFPNMRNVTFMNNSNLTAPTKAISSGDLTPSKKGLRRTLKPLPKPLPNRSNRSQKRLQDNQDDEINIHGNNEEKLPLTQQYDHQQQMMDTVATKRYINAKTMAYQMTMHHQSHQRTLQPRQRSTTNGNIRTTPSPPPNINAKQYPPPIVREDPGINRKNGKYHRHMSEPHIPSTFDGPHPFTAPINHIPMKVKYHHRHDIISNQNEIDNKSYKSSPNHLPEHHPNPRQSIHGVHGNISYPDSPGPESPPIAYADITDNENLSSPPMIPIQFEEHSRTHSSNSRVRSKSHPAKPPKIKSPIMNGNMSRKTDGWENDVNTGFIINNGYINANQTPVEDDGSYRISDHHKKSRHPSKSPKSPKSPKKKKNKHKRDKDKKRKKRERKMAITEDPSDDDGTLLTHKSHKTSKTSKTSKTTKTYKSTRTRHKKSNNKYPNGDRKRKASTPTPNAKDRRKLKHREREKGGSDKLHRRVGRTKDMNPFPRSSDIQQHKMNVSTPNLKQKERDKNKLHPPNHSKINKKRNGKSNSDPLWQPYQAQKQYYHHGDPRRQKLHPQNSNASSHTANTNITANTTHTFYTATTNSETPIPAEINPMSLSPINVGLVKSPINGKVNGQQGSPGKTTTISSAYVPPPPSPQLTNKRGNALSTNVKSPTTMPPSNIQKAPLSPPPPSQTSHHPLPPRPHQYHVHPPSPYQLPQESEPHTDIDIDPNRSSNNTDNTPTYDGGAHHGHRHHESENNPTRTPSRDLSGDSNTKTVTYGRNTTKYGISPNSTVLTKSPPQPPLDALHSGQVMAIHTHPPHTTLSPQQNITYSPDGISSHQMTMNGINIDGNTNSSPQQRYRIRVEGAHTHTTTTTDCNTTSSETNSDDGDDDDDSTESSQSSESESEFDGVNTSETRKLVEKNSLIKSKNHLQFERKHYIVGSMDSDGKTMFGGLPPVPMQPIHPHHGMPINQPQLQPQQMIVNQSMETNYGTVSSEALDDEYKDVPLQNPYGGRQLRPLPDTDSVGTISPDWRQYQQHYNHDYTINKLKRLKFKNHRSDRSDRSGSSNNNDEESQSQQSQYMATISTVTKTPSPEDSHNDEEKAYAPSQPGNNPYLLEPKKTSNTSNTQSGSGSKTKSNIINNNNSNEIPSIHSSQPSNHYNHDFEKEYIFAQHLEDTIKTLTKSDQGSADDDDHQFLEQESFIKMTKDNNIWHRHINVNDGYVE